MEGEKTMKKLTLMKRFMKHYVGKGCRLVIKEKDGAFKVHTIEIMQKTDNTCPVKDIPIGDYFIHLVATNKKGHEASIVCNWTDDLLKSLMESYKQAKDADYSEITMFKNPLANDENSWMLSWGDKVSNPKADPIRYIS